MHILIVTACTGQKTVESPLGLRCKDFAQGADHVRKRERDLDDLLTPARDLYSGQQHVRLMRGIRATQEKLDIDLYIVSAGYGLISKSRKLAPYECTFTGRSKQDLKTWADQLRIPESFRRLVAKPYDLGLLLLGNDYLVACNLDTTVQFGGPTLVLCGHNTSKHLPAIKALKPISLGHTEARRFSCGLVGLKGEIAARLLRNLTVEPSNLDTFTDPTVDVLDLLDPQLKLFT